MSPQTRGLLRIALQSLRPVRLNVKFVFLTEQISFLPDNILNSTMHVSIPRPSRAAYGRCVEMKLGSMNTAEITNIKTLNACSVTPIALFCEDMIATIVAYEDLKFGALRDKLYNILILDLDLAEALWRIFTGLIEKGYITNEQIPSLMSRFYVIFHRYNNNYRPIMHLESFIFTLVTTIHGLDESKGYIGTTK